MITSRPRRRRVWEIMEIAEAGDKTSRLFDLALFILIALNILAIILESVGEFYANYHVFFDGFDAFSVTVFSIEYLLRLWSCVEDDRYRKMTPLGARMAYARSPIALVDFAAIAPFFIQFLFPGIDLRFLRVLRMLRVLKLTRYSQAVSLLLRVLYQERKSFGASFFILMVVLIIASCGIYLFEHDNQPEKFGSIPAAMWWAVATLTTVGYGDVTPISPAGKVFGAIVTIVGVGMVALPSGILASSFTEILRRKQKDYKLEVKSALEDGIITQDEMTMLDRLRRQMGFSREEAKELVAQTERELQINKRYEIDWEKRIVHDIEKDVERDLEEVLEHEIEEVIGQEIDKDIKKAIASHSPAFCPHCGGKL